MLVQGGKIISASVCALLRLKVQAVVNKVISCGRARAAASPGGAGWGAGCTDAGAADDTTPAAGALAANICQHSAAKAPAQMAHKSHRTTTTVRRLGRFFRFLDVITYPPLYTGRLLCRPANRRLPGPCANTSREGRCVRKGERPLSQQKKHRARPQCRRPARNGYLSHAHGGWQAPARTERHAETPRRDGSCQLQRRAAGGHPVCIYGAFQQSQYRIHSPTHLPQVGQHAPAPQFPQTCSHFEIPGCFNGAANISLQGRGQPCGAQHAGQASFHTYGQGLGHRLRRRKLDQHICRNAAGQSEGNMGKTAIRLVAVHPGRHLHAGHRPRSNLHSAGPSGRRRPTAICAS